MRRGTPGVISQLSRSNESNAVCEMGFLAWLSERFRGRRDSRGWERDLASAKERGDFRGSYGFGHRAHRPDPKARYGFENDANYRAHHSETP